MLVLAFFYEKQTREKVIFTAVNTPFLYLNFVTGEAVT